MPITKHSFIKACCLSPVSRAAIRRFHQTAAARSQQAGQLGAQAIDQAGQFGAQVFDQAGQFGAQFIDQASRFGAQAGQYGAAAFNQARERVAPVLSQAAERVAPLADDALERARVARAKAAGWAADHIEQAQPGIAAALDKVSPAVERAQKAIQEEFLPSLVGTLHDVAGVPKAEVVVVKRRSVGKTLLILAGVGAALAAIGLAIKTWLDSRDQTWSSYEPRQAYIYPDDEAEAGYEQDLTSDSYIGANPPEGFVIKGNARSKKYHVPGSRGYDRTIAEVWFQSEEAAEAAGFIKAQN